MKPRNTNHRDAVRKKILQAGIRLWRKDPKLVTASHIAREVDMTVHAVMYHFKPKDLQDAVAAHAVEFGDSRVIAQLIGMKHKAIKDMKKADKSFHLSVANA